MITNDKLDELVNTCRGFAPDDAVRIAFVKIRQAMKDDDEPNEHVARYLVGRLLDGLAHGNWPR